MTHCTGTVQSTLFLSMLVSWSLGWLLVGWFVTRVNCAKLLDGSRCRLAQRCIGALDTSY